MLFSRWPCISHAARVALAVFSMAAAAAGEQATGRVTHNGKAMEVQGALAVLDSGGYQLEIFLLPRKPTAEDLARAGHSPPGTYAYLMLYVSSLETATSKHELPLMVQVADIAGKNTSATVFAPHGKGSLSGTIKPGQTIELTATDEATDDSNAKRNPKAPKDVVSWDVKLSVKVLAGP